MPTSNECNLFIFLVVIVHVSHLYQSVDHTYALRILLLVFKRMCRAVIAFNIQLNSPLEISIFSNIASSHFPFGGKQGHSIQLQRIGGREWISVVFWQLPRLYLRGDGCVRL